MVRDETSPGRGRPKRRRRVQKFPPAERYEPVGLQKGAGQEVKLTLDEVEALRLADLEAIYHEEAASAMGVSRSTYGRVLESARHKVALALWEGVALVIDGGVIDVRGDGTPGRGGQGRRRGVGRRGKGEASAGNDRECDLRRSRDGGGLGFGSGGACICPKCGITQEHRPGRPCKRERCPECGVALLREGGEHHRAVLEAQAKKKTES